MIAAISNANGTSGFEDGVVGLTTIFQLIKSWFATGSENIFRGLLPASLRIS